jgi:hypothetical protein
MILLLILINNMNLIKTDTSQLYDLVKKRDTSRNFDGNVISISKKQSPLLCLANCNKKSDCLTTVFDQNNDCFFYNRYFTENETIPSETRNMHVKLSN